MDAPVNGWTGIWCPTLTGTRAKPGAVQNHLQSHLRSAVKSGAIHWDGFGDDYWKHNITHRQILPPHSTCETCGVVIVRDLRVRPD
jgi:hypothetical protein